MNHNFKNTLVLIALLAILVTIVAVLRLTR